MLVERLLIVADQEVQVFLESILTPLMPDVISRAALEFRAYAESVVELHAEKHYEIILIDQGVRRHARQMMGEEPDCAVKLVKDLRGSTHPAAILFLVNEPREDESHEIGLQTNCRALSYGVENFDQRLCDYITFLTKSTKDKKVTLSEQLISNFTEIDEVKAITVEFNLYNPERQACTICYDDDIKDRKLIDLSCDRRRLERFVSRCGRFEERYLALDDEGWREEFDEISQEALEILIASDELRDELDQAMALCQKTPEKLKIRFNIAERQYIGLFEVACSAEDDLSLMLKASTARKLNVKIGGSSRRLEWSREDPVNILIIESLVGSNHAIPDTDITLDDLEWAQRESAIFDRLKEALENEQAWSPTPELNAKRIAVNIRSENVRIIRQDEDETRSLANRIQDELERTQYDIVHYVGHSICVSTGGTGSGNYLVVPDARNGRAERISVEALSAWMKSSGVQFVYLSSCRSLLGGRPLSRAAVAREFARRMIPACLGFLWHIPDESAYRLAAAFYQSLLCETQNVDEALMRAREALYCRGDEKASWAAPVLFFQTDLWNSAQDPAIGLPIAVRP